MQQRAELLGGQLTADSSPGRGTVVRLRIPISPEHRGMRSSRMLTARRIRIL
jgi:signal transduction histidine kinase